MKTALFLSGWLLAVSAVADVSRDNARVFLAYDFSEDHAIAVAIGLGYFRHECRSVPGACGICSPSDTRSECDAKVAVATDEALSSPLPVVTRLASGGQRDICTGNETNQQCEAKISAHYGAIGLSLGHCVVVDPNAVTPEEWNTCELASAARGSTPSPDLDELPHFNACVVFLDLKTTQYLREARNEGRRRLAKDAAPEVDTTE